MLLAMFVVGEGVLQRVAYTRYASSAGSSVNAWHPMLGSAPIASVSLENGLAPGAVSTHNAQRIRGLREYGRAIPEGRERILLIGDSFTYGHCDDDETYPAWMERLRPSLQAINMGVGGHGFGQIWLNYVHRAPAFDADIALLVVISDNFARMPHSRTVWSKTPKPRAQLLDGRAVATSVPVPRFGGVSTSVGQWARNLPRSLGWWQAVVDGIERRDVDAYDYQVVTEAILEDVVARAAAQTQTVALVYLPVGEDLGEDPSAFVDREWLRLAAERAGIPYIDLVSHFEPLSLAERGALFPEVNMGGHFNGPGNRFVARALLAEIDVLRPASELDVSPAETRAK